MATLFSLDEASSSRMMSMSDRQSQLVLQRRQIIRQQSNNCGNSLSFPAHHQVATHNAGDSIAAHSSSKLSCIKHKYEVEKQNSSNEPKSTESCDKNSNHDTEKENKEAIISLNASWRGRNRNSSKREPNWKKRRRQKLVNCGKKTKN